MMLQVLRLSSSDKDTIGALYDVTDPEKRRFLCFTLEDEFRATKKAGETRIPAGVYPIELRTEGGFHQKYAKDKRFAAFHVGMLWVKNVPGFEFILIHCGNDEGDTAGCLLVGDEVRQNVTGAGALMKSGEAYARIYRLIAAKLQAGEQVSIMYVDLDDPERKLAA